MIKIKLTGHSQAIAAVTWLNKQRWQHDMNLESNDPFSGNYVFQINDPAHALMFKLKWGGSDV
jgi:hypothetical protein